MKDRIEINRAEDNRRPERKERKKRKVNKWGVYISFILIAAGLIWYAVNLGLIPVKYIQEQAGPLLAIILGILILIKSL